MVVFGRIDMYTTDIETLQGQNFVVQYPYEFELYLYHHSCCNQLLYNPI